jgi:hypothetical protein
VGVTFRWGKNIFSPLKWKFQIGFGSISRFLAGFGWYIKWSIGDLVSTLDSKIIRKSPCQMMRDECSLSPFNDFSGYDIVHQCGVLRECVKLGPFIVKVSIVLGSKRSPLMCFAYFGFCKYQLAVVSG